MSTINYPAGKRNLGILFIGDSHAQGMLANVVTGSTSNGELLGLFPEAGPRDLSWNGTAFRSHFPTKCQMDTACGTGSLDINAVATPGGSFASLIPQCLRLGGYNLGDIRVASFGFGGSSSFTWSAEPAYCHLNISAVPADGDTFVLGTQTYRWKTTPSQAYDIQIADTKEHCARNVEVAINGEMTGWSAAGVNNWTVYAGTVASAAAFSPSVRTDQYVRLTAKLTGIAGNNTVTTFSSSAMSFLSVWTGGADVAIALSNVIAAVPESTFGSVDVVCITLGTNDVARYGWRGAGFGTEMVKLIANLRAAYGADVKIILWLPPWIGDTTKEAIKGVNINPAVNAIVAADPTGTFAVDMHSLGQGAGNTKIVCADGVHCTQYGYHIAAQMYARKIATALNL